MAFFTGYLTRIGSLLGRPTETVAVVLAKSDDTPDLWLSNGAGAAQVEDAGAADAAAVLGDVADTAKQDEDGTVNAHLRGIAADLLATGPIRVGVDAVTTALGAGGAIRAGVDLVETAVDAVTTAVGNVLSAVVTPSTWTAVTPADATDLTALATKGLLVGVAGNIAVRTVGAPATTVTLAVVAGQYLPGQFTRVMAATTATGIVALS